MSSGTSQSFWRAMNSSLSTSPSPFWSELEKEALKNPCKCCGMVPEAAISAATPTAQLENSPTNFWTPFDNGWWRPH